MEVIIVRGFSHGALVELCLFSTLEKAREFLKAAGRTYNPNMYWSVSSQAVDNAISEPV